MKTVFIKPAGVERKWFMIDAEGKVLGRVAARAASIVRGKEKAVFAPHQEVGDYVVVVNADKIVVTGRKAQQKRYYHHTG
ncbi:MAG: 50S ribosomal protein L13, partial [Spirochaetaceae bacterium]|nr:50S ribosomal protein L13 [Spirochaetaceae bacterium]